MTKDRQIVAMLISRKRYSRKLLRELQSADFSPIEEQSALSHYSEAHFAAEYARRILYATELKCARCGSDHIKLISCEPIGLPQCVIAQCYACSNSWMRAKE